jgi:hypothetical protein
MIVVVSDFLQPKEEVFSSLIPFRKLKNEVILFQVLDKKELDFHFSGNIRFLDMERDKKVELNVNEIKKSYTEGIKNSLEYFKKETKKNGIEYLLFVTDKFYLNYLNNFLRLRAKKRK